MSHHKSNSTRSIAAPVLGFLALSWGGPAFGQYQTTPAPTPTYRYVQPARPRFFQRTAPVYPQRGYYSQPLPYNRSPYTDDWSTGRHLPYPKPWMLPTRDPAHRGPGQ